MTTSQDEFCKECGYRNCPHEGRTLPESTVSVVMQTKETPKVYDVSIDHSMDHKSNALKGQSIQFVMMHYFGDQNDAKSLLCYDWLKARGPIEPLDSLGDYLAYRSRYNFGELD